MLNQDQLNKLADYFDSIAKSTTCSKAFLKNRNISITRNGGIRITLANGNSYYGLSRATMLRSLKTGKGSATTMLILNLIMRDAGLVCNTQIDRLALGYSIRNLNNPKGAVYKHGCKKQVLVQENSAHLDACQIKTA